MKSFVLVEESGSYSDRSTNILGVFSSEEKALEAKKAFDKIKDNIEVFYDYNKLSNKDKVIFNSILSEYSLEAKKILMKRASLFNSEIDFSIEVYSFDLDEFDLIKFK